MKVWWLLSWESYYPCGSLLNVHSTYSTEQEAIEASKFLLEDGEVPWGSNVEIINISDML